ncbi:Calmodulin [Zancudomyces culisetae]|uniref:Calmodulin n=1 Tax=Zancudomyces culisetae TaxID=1213189 RepID=A0A1R1PJ65_ZANCU|nr:Calmodulin [Zancudomyces culisetae]|eukprot:OMH81045.1 Calmodulin [Zancudomyces culisetae]
MSAAPTEEQLAAKPFFNCIDSIKIDYREAFTLFDRTGEGKVPMSSVGTLLRALGQNPTEAEIRDITGDLDPNDGKSIDFDDFLKILLRPGGFKSAATEATFNEFVQAFQVFDREGNGFISVGELRYVLTSLGDRLTDAEVDELLKGVEVDNHENINYEGKDLTI